MTCLGPAQPGRMPHTEQHAAGAPPGSGSSPWGATQVLFSIPTGSPEDKILGEVAAQSSLYHKITFFCTFCCSFALLSPLTFPMFPIFQDQLETFLDIFYHCFSLSENPAASVADTSQWTIIFSVVIYDSLVAPDVRFCFLVILCLKKISICFSGFSQG